MKLNKIEIIGLWHEHNLSWNLNKDVNIIVGGNGAGKTTIFDLVCSTIPPYRMQKNLIRKADKIKLVFDGDYTVQCINFRDSFLSLKERAEDDPSYKILLEEVSEDVGERHNSQLDFGIFATLTQFFHKGKQIKPTELEDLIQISIVSTFDAPLPKKDDESLSFKELSEERPMSHLDKNLFDCMEQYSYYIGSLANKIEQHVLNGNEVTTEFVHDVYSQKHLFVKIMNEFFAESGKKIDISKSKPDFELKSGKHISMYDLSSGEKQILYIMLKVLLQEKQNYIVFMDEPELSLHVDWQEKLIDKILQLNPNCQLVIATHSPSLLFNGWDSNVVNIEDLKK